MRKIPELLAPAGGPQQLRAAVQNGADSVYVGGKLFNARQNAENFSDEELVEAIRYAHVRGVNVYMTCNTLVSDTEMPEALQYAIFAYNAGIDGIIVQDLGLADLLKKTMPDLPLHLSTQGSTYNPEGVQIAAELGFSRVVLARELHSEEIRHIATHSPIETEVFVHGALCVCYSGQCLMSSMIGGRSGNRGLCAQPCRLAYQLFSVDLSGRHKQLREKCHLLSPSDLCLLPRLTELIETGVSCLKIEGRMKSPEYVAITTRIYRKYLDRYASGEEGSARSGEMVPEKADMQALLQIFSRGGFTTGYFDGKQGFGMIAAERSKHEGVYLGKVVQYHHHKKLVEIKLENKLSIGDGIEILAEGLPGNVVTSFKQGQDRCTSADAGDTVQIGYIQGKVSQGDKVYKISDKEQLKEARESFEHGPERTRPIDMLLLAKMGKAPELFVSINDAYLHNKHEKAHNIYVTSSEHTCEPALTKPLTKERIQGQLSKTGGTPFCVNRCEVDMDENIAVPLSEINALRRKALGMLAEKLQDRYPDRKPVQKVSMCLNKKSHQDSCGRQESAAKSDERKVSLYFFNWKETYELPDIPADRMYIPYQCFLEPGHRRSLQRYAECGIELVAAFPAVTKGYHDKNIKDHQYELAKHPYISGLMIGNPGHLIYCRGMGLPVYADISLNVYNRYTAEVLGRLGIKGAGISYELIEMLTETEENRPEYEAVIQGNVPVMYSEYCPVSCRYSDDAKKLTERTAKDKEYYLVDRMGKRLPILTDCDSCQAIIFSDDGRKTGIQNQIRAGGVQRVRINILHHTEGL